MERNNDFNDRRGTEDNMYLLDHILKCLHQTWKCGCRTKLYAFLYAFLFSFSMVLGKALYDTNDIDTFLRPSTRLLRSALLIIVLCLGLGFFMTFLFRVLEESDRSTWTVNSEYKKYFRVSVCTLALFVAWLPAYLAYYPGILSYDMGWQTSKALGEWSDISRYQPPLHTILWKGCLYMGKSVGVEPIIVYSIPQMLLMAWSCARLFCLMARKDCSKWILIVGAVFFALNPVIAICSFVPAKDMCFAVCFMLLGVELCEFLSDKGAYMSSGYGIIRLVLMVTLCCLFRNNAVYAMILLLLFIPVCLRAYRIRCMAAFLAGILLFLGINGPLFDHLKIREGRSAEMLSVPMQQIAYVVCTGQDLSEDEIGEIDAYLPYEMIPDTYNPRFADPIKGCFDTDEYEDDKGRFFRLWWNLFLKYPKEYVNAFLTLNLPYWYPGASAVDEYSQREYIETSVEEAEYTFERASKLPWLYTLYERAASYEMFENVPVLSHLFSLSTVVWILLAGIFTSLLKRKGETVLIFLPSFLLWFTFMAGPVSNFRYIFPIYIQYPLFVAVICQSGRLLPQKSVQ